MVSTCTQCGTEYPNASAAEYCCNDKPRPWDDGDW